MLQTLCILILLLAACEEEGHYRRRSVAELLQSAKPEDRGHTDPPAGNSYKETPTEKAIWAAVAQAERQGLEALYGVELMGDEGGYRALFLIRTRTASVCLFADSEMHGAREDATTVPWAAVEAADMKQLARRVGAQLPPVRAVSLTSEAFDGTMLIIHVFHEGKSYTMLWDEPLLYPGIARATLERFHRAYPGHALVQAIWASAPPAALPASKEDYAKRPGWKP